MKLTMIKQAYSTSIGAGSSAERHGVVRPGVMQSGAVRPCVMRSGAVRSGIARFVLPIALSMSLCSCSNSDKEVIGDQTDAVRELPVVTVEYKTLDRVDQIPGEIEAYQDVAIYPKVPGFIKWIGVDRGSVVKKGQLMVGLIAPELHAQTNEAYSKTQAVSGQLHEAESRLASAKAQVLEVTAKLEGDNDTYTRTAEASKVPGVVSANEVIVLEKIVAADKEKLKAWQENVRAAQNAVTALKNSVVSQSQATKNYSDIADYLTIAAPFDGYITERNMHVGSFVGPLGKGAYPPIVRIQQLNLLRIIAPVPEIDTSGVIPGAQVQFTVSTHPGEKFTGTVARLGNYLDQKTRTMPVELNYWNHDNRVLPGMFCEVYWPTKRQHPTLFVPMTAVETNSTIETFVCRVSKDNKVEWVKVKRGQMMGNMVEIFGDINQGDRVALHGSDELKQGTEVKPVEVDRRTAEAAPEPRPVYHSMGASMVTPDPEREKSFRTHQESASDHSQLVESHIPEENAKPEEKH
ncbi:MAG TPA: efflux RND transporter periplasmic adaptor subunit [Drouetiella sp.]|jgi:membrane fusion protein, multidrug efflux system